MRNKMPYSVPEGYFQEMQEKMKTVPYLRARVSPTPYLALAASFLLLLGIGTFILSRTAPADYVTNEEIAEYLIESGTTLAQLEEVVYY